jgi:hypothetical protein
MPSSKILGMTELFMNNIPVIFHCFLDDSGLGIGLVESLWLESHSRSVLLLLIG